MHYSNVFRRYSREEPLMNLLNILSQILQPLYFLPAGTKESCQAFFIILNFWYADQLHYNSTGYALNRTLITAKKTDIGKQSIQPVVVDPRKDLPHHLKHLSNFFFQRLLVGYVRPWILLYVTIHFVPQECFYL